MNPIDYIYLIAIGIAFMAFEIVISSFVLFWFGLGFLSVGCISIFYPFSDGLIQIALSFTLGALMLYTLKDRFVKTFMNSQEKHTDFFEEKGTGIVQNGKIFYKGTYWDANLDGLKEGDKVIVTKINHGNLEIQKLEYE